MFQKKGGAVAYLGHGRILRVPVVAIRPYAISYHWQYFSEARKSRAFVHDLELDTKGNTCEIWTSSICSYLTELLYMLRALWRQFKEELMLTRPKIIKVGHFENGTTPLFISHRATWILCRSEKVSFARNADLKTFRFVTFQSLRLALCIFRDAQD